MQIPVALTIAGSDNSAGAGVQADLKTMSALGVYGLTAVTCVVAEVPGRVSAIQPIEPAIVAEQIRLSFDAFPVAAVKTGMLFSRAIIDAVIVTLAECLKRSEHRPALIVDPVMVATSGDTLLQPEAVTAYEEKLLPLATLVTPNMDEVRVLLGSPAPPRDVAELKEAGRTLAAKYGCSFLIKGGHLRTEQATDVLVQPDGTAVIFTQPFVAGVSTHGTGCTTSAAITASLARGLPLQEAVAEAKTYVYRAILNHLRWGRESEYTDALHHFAGGAAAVVTSL